VVSHGSVGVATEVIILKLPARRRSFELLAFVAIAGSFSCSERESPSRGIGISPNSGAVTSAEPDLETAPLMASLVTIGSPSMQVCRAVMLDCRHALSAAHCFTRNPRRLFGLLLSSSGRQASEVIPVSDVVIHPKFSLRSRELALSHDLAIVTLFNRLPSADRSDQIQFGSPIRGATVLLGEHGGWIADLLSPLSRGRVENVSAVEFRLSPTPPPSPCYGDSGGGVFSEEHPHALVGILSRGAVDTDTKCSQGAIYSRTDIDQEWIVNVIGQGC
jgi:Trypsin